MTLLKDKLTADAIMSNQQQIKSIGDSGVALKKRIIDENVSTNKTGIQVKLVSIRGGGGGPTRKRPDIADDGLYDSEEDGEPETEKLSSNRLRNKKLKSEPASDISIKKFESAGNVIPKKLLVSNSSDVVSNEATSLLLSNMKPAPVIKTVNQPVSTTNARLSPPKPPPSSSHTTTTTTTSPQRTDLKPFGASAVSATSSNRPGE